MSNGSIAHRMLYVMAMMQLGLSLRLVSGLQQARALASRQAPHLSFPQQCSSVGSCESRRGAMQKVSAAGAANTATEAPAMPLPVWIQKTVTLPNHPRGCHVITRNLVSQLPELQEVEVGLANFFIQHTSASLTINENASPDVPLDLADMLDVIVPEGNKHAYRHDDEGPDDMPAHVKSSLMGPSLTVPVQHGRLALGTWQGIYLNEHRNYGGPRRIVITIQGQKRTDGRKYGSHR